MQELIYILEDDLDIGELMVIVLDEYETKVFPTVAQFQNALTAKLPDLFLLDIMLPDGNGLDVCKSLRKAESTKALPVILLSASYSNETVKKAGANQFISKPFDIYDLKQKVKELIVPAV